MECPVCETEVATAYGRFVAHGDCAGGFAEIDKASTLGEDRYTPPSEWCPNPERWGSEDWDSAEIEVSDLVASLVRCIRPEAVLETGSAFGQTAQLIGEVLYAAGLGTLYTIEPDSGRANATRERCEGLPVVVEQMKSLDYTPHTQFGFAWFDSLLPLRVPEFRHFYDHLAPGAIVGFHDVAPHFGPALQDDIEQLEADGMLLPMYIRTPRGVCFGEVIH